MAIIRITDLKIRTIIGINDWERETSQEVLINITMDCAVDQSIESDQIADTVDYKNITKTIIKEVEASNFFLLEKLTNTVLQIVLKDSRVKKATVRIDKPLALRFAQSVSVELSGEQNL